MSHHQIYFLQRADGLIKIGTSANFPRRLASLTASHGLLGVIRVIHGDRAREKALHRKFKRFAEYGEWFRDQHGELTALIMDLEEGTALDLTTSKTEAAWRAGEAELMVEIRRKIDEMIKARMDRELTKREAAQKAITEAYGFPKWFLEHIRVGRARTVSAYGSKRIREAYLFELKATLAHFEAELAA